MCSSDLANSSGVKITHSKNLTKATKNDWIWGKTDQGAWNDSGMKDSLGNAWIANLKSDTNY